MSPTSLAAQWIPGAMLAVLFAGFHQAQGGGPGLPPDQIAILRKTAPTTTGTQSFTSNKIDEFDGAIFIVSGTDADGSSQAHARYSIGFCDDQTFSGGEDEISHGRRVLDGEQNNQISRTRGETAAIVIYTSDPTSTAHAYAEVSAIHSNGVTLNWVVAPDKPYRITCILFGGDGDAFVGIGNTSSPGPSVSLPFQADVIFFYGTTISLNGTGLSYHDSIGFASNNGGIQQGSIGHSFPNAVNPTESNGVISNTKALALPQSSPLSTLQVDSIYSSGFDVSLNSGAADFKFGYLAINFSSLKAKVTSHALTGSTGVKTFSTPSITPSAVFTVANLVTGFDTIATDSTAGTPAFSCFTSSKESSIAWSNEDGRLLSPTTLSTVCRTHSESIALTVLNQSGSKAQQASLYALTGGSYSLDFTTANASGNLISLAIGLPYSP